MLAKLSLKQWKQLLKDIQQTEYSIQEAVYHILPELWLLFWITFLNSNIPEKLYGIFEKKSQSDKLPEDITEIFQHNMLDIYLDRSDGSFKNGMYRETSNIYFSEFLSLFYSKSVIIKDLEIDYQSVILDDELLETHHKVCNYPKDVSLMSSKEKLKCRKVKALLRYYHPNPNKAFETYAYHLIF